MKRVCSSLLFVRAMFFVMLFFVGVLPCSAQLTVEYYDSGVKKAEGIMRHGKKDSVWVMYHENGNKKWEGRYEGGIMNGRFRLYYQRDHLLYHL